MNKTNWALYLFIFLLSTNFFACKNDFENYSNNPQDLLSFSIDTLSFDTVLSTVNSPVRIFCVYNKNTKPLLISSVKLAEGTNSDFKINVDGMAGSVFENVEILANDSIFIFVDVKPKENGKYTPAIFNDYIIFETNGVQQKVVLEAFGQDVFVWRGVVLSTDSVLNNQKPYLIYDSLVIDKGATVEIGENTVFYMFNDAQLIVNGTIKIKGTAENPVVFRGNRTDYLTGNIPYDLIPGQWGGIRFTSESFDNELENVRIRNGKYGMFLDVCKDPSRNKLYMKNVVLTSVTGTLFQAVNCNIIAENCEFSNAKDILLYIIGGSSRFTHCTIVNYYPSNNAGMGFSDYKTLSISDVILNWGEGQENDYYPVNSAEFYNCIIFGLDYKPDSAIKIVKSQPESERPFFKNCLLPETKSSNLLLDSCYFQTKDSDLFVKTNSVDSNKKWHPSFDFRLHKDSPAKNAANIEIATQIPYDMNGLYRFTDGFPDIGAYEFHEEN
jgi:hypothetical protein